MNMNTEDSQMYIDLCALAGINPLPDACEEHMSAEAEVNRIRALHPIHFADGRIGFSRPDLPEYQAALERVRVTHAAAHALANRSQEIEQDREYIRELLADGSDESLARAWRMECNSDVQLISDKHYARCREAAFRYADTRAARISHYVLPRGVTA